MKFKKGKWYSISGLYKISEDCKWQFAGSTSKESVFVFQHFAYELCISKNEINNYKFIERK